MANIEKAMKADMAEFNKKCAEGSASELNALLSLHGWGLRRHVAGQIVVTHKDGSGVLIRDDAESIAETLFYRMMDNFLTAR